MSKAKNQLTRSPARDWRKEVYSGQKRTIEKVHFENNNFYLKPGALSVTFTLLLLTSMLIPPSHAKSTHLPNKPYTPPNIDDPASYKSATESLVHKIQSKMEIDPFIPKENHANLQCQRIPEALFKSPLPTAHVERVLKHPNFKILCTSSRSIARDTQGLGGAFFNNRAEKIIVSSAINAILANHEFIHADNYFRHTQEPCLAESTDEAFLPFHPVNEQTIQQYKNALNLGDSRLNTFKALLQKEKNHQKLTPGETKRLNKYKKAVQDCPNTMLITTHSQQYDNMLASGWYPGMRGVTFIYDDAPTEILEAERKEDLTLVKVKILDVPAWICHIPLKVQRKLSTTYKDASDFIKLAERDANTFESLTLEAIQTFYPEAHKIREEDLIQCDSHLNRP